MRRGGGLAGESCCPVAIVLESDARWQRAGCGDGRRRRSGCGDGERTRTSHLEGCPTHAGKGWCGAAAVAPADCAATSASPTTCGESQKRETDRSVDRHEPGQADPWHGTGSPMRVERTAGRCRSIHIAKTSKPLVQRFRCSGTGNGQLPGRASCGKILRVLEPVPPVGKAESLGDCMQVATYIDGCRRGESLEKRRLDAEIMQLRTRLSRIRSGARRRGGRRPALRRLRGSCGTAASVGMSRLRTENRR